MKSRSPLNPICVRPTFPDPLTMSCQKLTDRLKAEAIRLGFAAVGVAPAVAPPGYPDFVRWLDSGPRGGDGLSASESVSPIAPEPSARRRSLGDHGQPRLRSAPRLSPCRNLPAEALSHSMLAGELITTPSSGGSSRSCSRGCAPSAPTSGDAPSPIRRRSSNAISPGWPGWAGSARTPC